MGKQSNACSGYQTVDRQPVREEDTFLWLSRGDMKGSEIIAEEGQATQKIIMKEKHYKQKQMVMQAKSTIL